MVLAKSTQRFGSLARISLCFLAILVFLPQEPTFPGGLAAGPRNRLALNGDHARGKKIILTGTPKLQNLGKLGWICRYLTYSTDPSFAKIASLFSPE